MGSAKDNEFVITQFINYGKLVLRIAYQNTGNMSEAEDIVQEVFLKLIKEDKVFTADEHIKAWLIRVTVNQCRDYLRSSRLRKNVTYSEDNLSSPLYEEGRFNLEEKQIFEEVRKLPPKYRNVIYLYYIEEYTVPEIAKLLAAKENTVSSWLRRAKRKLRIEMEGGKEQYEEGSLYCGNAKS
jgi:RNA polymerase sigma-70 factor (ECF subfamily)